MMAPHMLRFPWWMRTCVLLLIAVVPGALSAVKRNSGYTPCTSVLPQNYRCHWPEENFNCECVEGAVCHDEDHHCVCHVGLTGTQCEQACAYPRDTPNPTCYKSCHNTTCTIGGTCQQQPSLCACLPGYSGPDCNWCDPTHFLDQCGKCPTHTCQNGGKCDIIENRCVCAEGYEGPPDRHDCSYCDPSVHPNRCLEHCNYDCNQGICDTKKRMCNCPNKALQGYDCSLCIPAEDPGNCTMYCHGYCLESGFCNITQKQCVCLPGLYGQFCEFCNQTAQPVKCKEYCSIDCKNGLCSVKTGKCICDEGYSRADCGFCRPSEHPQKCLNHCPFECHNSDCLVSSGMCQCAPGLLGKDCRMCDPKLHNQNCTNHCKHACQQGSSCDTLTGLCECLPGWIGPACNNSCPHFTFGINCSELCHCDGGPCHPATGECIIVEKPLTTLPVITTIKVATSAKPTLEKTSTEFIYVVPGKLPGKGDVNIHIKPPADTSASAPNKSAPTIVLLALVVCLLFVLIIISLVFVLRKHYKKKQFENDSRPEQVPLNNLLVPVSDSNINEDDAITTLESPLVPMTIIPEPVDGLYTTIVEECSRPSSLLVIPNPRKSTNLDADAQRLFVEETGQPFFLGKSPKNLQIQKNIFDEKKELAKDKLKRDNFEETVEELKKEAEEDNLKGCSKMDKESIKVPYEVRSGGTLNRRIANQGQDKHTDSGFCEEDNLDMGGAAGGTDQSDCIDSGARRDYHRLESGNESTSSESLNERRTLKTPVYSEINFDTKSSENNLRIQDEGDGKNNYEHLQRLDSVLDSDSEVTLKNPRYSKLTIPASALKGYSHLEHGPRRRDQPEKRLLGDGEYSSLQMGDTKDSGDEEQ